MAWITIPNSESDRRRFTRLGEFRGDYDMAGPVRERTWAWWRWQHWNLIMGCVLFLGAPAVSMGLWLVIRLIRGSA